MVLADVGKKIVSHRKTIHFHVGAHKTATTYMQSSLRSNRERLAACNIDFVDLWARQPAERLYRRSLTLSIESGSPESRDLSDLATNLRDIVTDASPSRHSLAVLSFENMLGSYDLTRGPAPYPYAAAAAQHIVDAFPDSDIQLFFSIRSLDRFLESGYLQRVVTRRETRKFEQYVSEVDLEALSWIRVVRALESVVGAENLTLWEYESFFSAEAEIWRDLLNSDDPKSLLVSPAKKSNSSLSAKGLKYMRSINRVATPADARRFRRFVKATFGLEKGQKSPRLLDDARREMLLKQYERDRDELGDLLGRSPPLRQLVGG